LIKKPRSTAGLFYLRLFKCNVAKIPIFAPIMLLTILKSKLHRVRVTEANINYVGSITIDEDLMDASSLVENEKVQVLNINNGERLETYVIKGKRGSGIICLNGPAARKALTDDLVIVIAYAQMTPEEAKNYKPVLVYPDSITNKLK
jgi:aspartate 1-decarboxylase